jgi:cell division protein FtsW (lipid II flippase)
MTISFLVKFIFKGLCMKKLFLGLVLLVLVMSVANAKNYQCSRYKNGDYQGFVRVSADSKSEAYDIAVEKYKKMEGGIFGISSGYSLTCKRSIF